jgi:glycine dehydrogenase subunit 1
LNYLPHTPEDRAAMLAALGIDAVDPLFEDIPPAVRLDRPLRLAPALTEMELEAYFSRLGAQNRSAAELICFLGGGATDRYSPALVAEVMGRAEFLTAYTPYQPEISQGTLQAIYEFQTMIAELTGMDLAQASMYDGATAAAEAAMLAAASTGRRRVVVSGLVHPASLAVIRTYAVGRGLEVVVASEAGRSGRTDLQAVEASLTPDTACLVVQEPNHLGALEPVAEAAELAHRAGALLVAQVDPISLAVLEPPGAWGADVAVGEGQALGLPLAYGGPYLGFFAARESLVRRLPGRLAGATYDRRGKRGYVLTFQTREQHIRRERATSNICTNQGLLALGAAVYLAALGPRGLAEAAERSLALAHLAADRLASLPGVSLAIDGPFFDEFPVRTAAPPAKVAETLLRHGILGGTDLGVDLPVRAGDLLFAVTERRTEAEVDRLVAAMAEATA